MTFNPVRRSRRAFVRSGALLGSLALLTLSASAFAEGDSSSDAAAGEDWSLHGQMTNVIQFHPGFSSAYRGPNSMDPGSRGDETFDLTVFAGLRLWNGGEAYINPEIDQGFGLSDTLGAAAFPSGEAYKVGSVNPYFRLQRLFFRQTFNLGGDTQKIDPDANQLGGSRTADNIIFTAGKMSVVDIFDTNTYAHDPRGDFFNWAIIDAGPFDYAADSWGYSYGAAAEWTQDRWTLRQGLFDLSKVPNEKHLETNFSQFEVVTELEERHKLFGHDGKVKVLGFLNRGRMGDYNDAIRLAGLTHTTPSTALVRNYASRPGATLNLEQGLTDDLGVFARAGVNDGSKEAYEFTEINSSISAGLSLKGTGWSRSDDTIGVAEEVGDISDAARNYLAHGGLGILIGDGKLVHYGLENVLETYYSTKLSKGFTATFDYQFIDNPAYNRDRGPISVFGLRFHAEL